MPGLGSVEPPAMSKPSGSANLPADLAGRAHTEIDALPGVELMRE